MLLMYTNNGVNWKYSVIHYGLELCFKFDVAHVLITMVTIPIEYVA